MTKPPIPPDAKMMHFLCVRDRAEAKAFYGETLGLTLSAEDPFALVFESDGRMLRISALKDFKPQTFTVAGWAVKDVRAAITALKAKGVTFTIYEGFGQDEYGVWTAPGGDAQVAWFNDPSGNVLSVTQF